MSDIGLNLGPLTHGAVVAFLVAVLGTPLAWRATRGAARWPRIAAVTLACVGTAGLFSLPSCLLSGAMERTAFSAVLLSAVMQSFLLPFLALLPRKA